MRKAGTNIMKRNKFMFVQETEAYILERLTTEKIPMAAR